MTGKTETTQKHLGAAPVAENLPVLVTTEELADILLVTPLSVRTLFKSGQIPAYRLGRALRFDVHEVLGLLRVIKDIKEEDVLP